MRALITDGKGLDSLGVEDVADPGKPGPGEVLVEGKAFSLNYRDVMVAEGRYGRDLEGPQICGSDIAGVVLETGEGVENVAPGDEVISAPVTAWTDGIYRDEYKGSFLGGGGVDGVIAERTVLPAAGLVKFEQMHFHQAATLPVAGLTAWACLTTHGGLRPGGSVLCLGTGGVSIFAAQIAHAMGCQVIITSSSNEKLQRCGGLFKGNLIPINYEQMPEWQNAVMDVTEERGVDVVVETVGGDSLEKSIECVTNSGVVCSVGILAGVDSRINIVKLLTRQVQVKGMYMGSARDLGALTQFMERAHLRPIIDRRFDIEEAAKAYRYMEAGRHFGKVVIEMV